MDRTRDGGTARIKRHAVRAHFLTTLNTSKRSRGAGVGGMVQWDETCDRLLRLGTPLLPELRSATAQIRYSDSPREDHHSRMGAALLLHELRITAPVGSYERADHENKMILHITIPRVPLGKNNTTIRGVRVLGLKRMHWASYIRYRNDWEIEIKAALNTIRVYPKEHRHRMRVQITQYRSRLLDKDSLYSSCAVILDCLQRLLVIHRDSEKWIDFEATQFVGSKEADIIPIRTEITEQEIE